MIGVRAIRLSAKDAALSSLIAAMYVVLTTGFAAISYGPIQLRLSEILTVLPFLYPPAALGLFAGCLIANILGGLGPWDIFGGSFLTLIAALLTARMPKMWLAPLPPVIVNALGVSFYLSLIFQVPYWVVVLQIGISEAIVCYGFGLPLLYFLKRSGVFERILSRKT